MAEPSDAAVVRLAWMMWCWNEGYRTPEDRAIVTNWFGEPQANPTDEATRQHLLTMAREVLSV